MTDDQILVTILALSDAPRLPIRDWSGDLPGVRYHRQLDLAGLGVSLPARGSPAERARQSEQVARLAQAGLLVQSGATKAARVRLTPEGEARARALSRPDWLAVSSMLVSHIAAMLGGSDLWLPETALPCPGNESEIDALPALAGGGLIVTSTYRGLAAYRPGQNAANWLAEPTGDEIENPHGPEWQTYRETIRAELAAMATAPTPDPREIGGVPLGPTEILWPETASISPATAKA